MARIRTIKPEFWAHEDLSALPESTHMLAAALLNYADDEGYFNANPALVRASCSPLREPSVSIHDSLKSLSEIGYIRVGTGSDKKRYGQIVKFADHQRINRPTASKISELGIVWDDSITTHTQLTEDSPLERKGKEQGKEGKGTFAPAEAAAVVETPMQVACRATWEAYSAAYLNRYGTEPVRNAKVNSQVVQFVKNLGADEAPQVAAYFLTLSDQFFLKRCHSLDILLTQCTAIRTQWATGRAITSEQARQQDRTATNAGNVAEAVNLAKQLRDQRGIGNAH